MDELKLATLRDELLADCRVAHHAWQTAEARLRDVGRHGHVEVAPRVGLDLRQPDVRRRRVAEQPRARAQRALLKISWKGFMRLADNLKSGGSGSRMHI